MSARARGAVAAVLGVLLVCATMVALAGLTGGGSSVAAGRCNVGAPHPNKWCIPTTPPVTTPTAPSTPPTTPPGPWSCITSDPDGSCGAYIYPGIVNSNGFNTYVVNNCWADPQCDQTIYANAPGDWQVVSNEPAGNTSVLTYPDVQQLMNNWCGTGWGDCANPTDTPISALVGLTFSYALTMPSSDSGVIAQAAYDIWTSNYADEIMIWVDNDNRGDGGATFDAEFTTSDGRQWTLYHFGQEIIWSLGARGTFEQVPAMSDAPVYELMTYLTDHGYVAANAGVTQIQFGWEICSTGGSPQTFRLTGYGIN